MRRKLLIAGGAILAVLSLVVGLPVGWFFTDPVGVARWSQRLALGSALPDADTVEGERGPIHVWRGGAGDGPTVVFVHGFADSGAGWTEVAGAVAEHHKVLVVDLPGHGLSGPPRPPLVFDDMSSGLERVVDGIDGPVVLVGNSLGGWLSMRYGLNHPERVAKVIVVNGGGKSWPIDRDLLMPKTREAVEAKNKVILGEHTVDLPGFMLDAFVAEANDPRLQTLFDDIVIRGERTLDAELPGIQVPVELVWGEGDDFFPHDSYAVQLRELLPEPRPQLRTLPGCGHAPQYSCAPELVEVILPMIP